MIEFTNNILIESGGNFEETNRIIGVSDWMITTKALVVTDRISCFFVLHLYNDKKIVIYETEHPTLIDVPEDDFRELHKWTELHGWDGPYAHDRLLNDGRSHEFWLRFYRAGIIKNNLLFKLEQEEIERFSKITQQDEEDDN